MFCNKCGNKVLVDSDFCINCGERVNTDGKQWNAAEERVNATQPLNISRNVVPSDDSADVNSALRIKEKLFPILVGALIILIIVIILVPTVIMPAISGKPSNSNNAEANNSSNPSISDNDNGSDGGDNGSDGGGGDSFREKGGGNDNYDDKSNNKNNSSGTKGMSSQDSARLFAAFPDEESSLGDSSSPSTQNNTENSTAPFESPEEIEFFSVDSYIGRKYTDVERELQRENIRSTETRVFNDYDEGLIISQSQPRGAKLSNDGASVISFEVSDGPHRILLPNYANIGYRDAEADLRLKGLKTEIVDAESETVVKGNVIRTEPTAGTEVEEGRRIIVFRSLGQEEVQKARVPSLLGMNYAEAKETLDSRGFNIGLTFPDSDLNSGYIVIRQSLLGTLADVGSSIDLWFAPLDMEHDMEPDKEPVVKEDDKSASSPNSLAIYTVKSGDILPRIANRFYGSSRQEYIDLIKHANGLTSDVIYVNQKLTIPPIPSSQDQESTADSPIAESTLQPSPQSSTQPTSAQIPATSTSIPVSSTGQTESSGYIMKTIKLEIPTNMNVEDKIRVLVEVTPSDTGLLHRAINRSIPLASFPYSFDVPVPIGGTMLITIYYNEALVREETISSD